jgi:hypothetical protein
MIIQFMTEKNFMQLILLLLLLCGFDCKRLGEMKPLLKTIGGEEAERVVSEAEKSLKEAQGIINQAQQVSSAIKAVQSLSHGLGGNMDVNNIVSALSGCAINNINNNNINNNNINNNHKNKSPANGGCSRVNNGNCEGNRQACKEVNAEAYPLKPISDIADDDIFTSLSRYITTGC